MQISAEKRLAASVNLRRPRRAWPRQKERIFGLAAILRVEAVVVVVVVVEVANVQSERLVVVVVRGVVYAGHGHQVIVESLSRRATALAGPLMGAPLSLSMSMSMLAPSLMSSGSFSLAFLAMAPLSNLRRLAAI